MHKRAKNGKKCHEFDFKTEFPENILLWIFWNTYICMEKANFSHLQGRNINFWSHLKISLCKKVMNVLTSSDSQFLNDVQLFLFRWSSCTKKKGFIIMFMPEKPLRKIFSTKNHLSIHSQTALVRVVTRLLERRLLGWIRWKRICKFLKDLIWFRHSERQKLCSDSSFNQTS